MTSDLKIADRGERRFLRSLRESTILSVSTETRSG